MTLGAPLMLAEHGVMSFSLAAGHVLTESNIRQMTVRHAEFVCVLQADTRSDAERAAAWLDAETRLQQIFHCADLTQPATAGLYQAVLAYRRA